MRDATSRAAGTRNLPPRATAMLESLRGLGYTTATALADIIDNAISAGAAGVDVDFVWEEGASFVRITDDGRGMEDAELEQAMRLGARDPRDARAADDLGRFGMGLKTASFSQARRLTVASRRAGGAVSCLRWDLDRLADAGPAEWPLLEGPHPGSEPRLAAIDTASQGTIVLWEMLDRIVTPGFGVDDLLALLDEVERHLAMVYHRLLDGSGPGFRLRLNGRAVAPWDPFLLGHPAKGEESPEYRLAGGVRVQCHVLPHRDMLKDKLAEQAAGPGGWILQQGFYIYRERRLLVAGGWMSLGEHGRAWARDEAHRLARIRIDIPNSADADWKINILKSRASVPVTLRRDLTRLATRTRETARRVFANRGRLAPAGGGSAALPELWTTRTNTRGTSYRIDRDHELVRSILDQAGPLRQDIVALMRLIEETLPVQRIWLDTAEQRETPRNGFDVSPPEEIIETMQVVFRTLTLRRGLSAADARQALSATTPFDRYPQLIARLGTGAETDQ